MALLFGARKSFRPSPDEIDGLRAALKEARKRRADVEGMVWPDGMVDQLKLKSDDLGERLREELRRSKKREKMMQATLSGGAHHSDDVLEENQTMRDGLNRTRLSEPSVRPGRIDPAPALRTDQPKAFTATEAM